MSYNQQNQKNQEDPPDFPKNACEWWRTFDHYAKEIRDLVATYHPVYARYSPPAKITAQAAEQACDLVRENIEKYTEEDPLVAFDRMSKNRNPRLSYLLNETWFGIPESADSRSLSGFFPLCDLCSESYVLYPESWEGEE